MTEFLLAAPALTYLTVLTAVLLIARRCPPPLHLAALIAGLAWRGYAEGPVTAAVALAIGAVAFLVLAAVARRLLSSVGLLALSVGLALLPVADWPGLAVGVALMGLTAAVVTARTAGSARVNMLTFETLAAMGVSPTGFQRPNASRLPATRDKPPSSTAKRLYLPPFLLAGIGLWLAGRVLLF